MVVTRSRWLTLSDLVIAGNKQVNPHIDEAERMVDAYCTQLGIKMPHFKDYTTMTAYLYPRTELHRLVPMNLILNLQWYVDDMFDRDRIDIIPEKDDRVGFFTTCLDILNTGVVTEDQVHPFFDVFKLLHGLFAPYAAGDWLQRFTDSLRPHFEVTTDPLDDMGKNPLANVEHYVELREVESGMRPTIDMIEFAYNIYLPDEIMVHPFIHKMTIRTALVGALMNDLYSYEKEVIRLNSRFNILRILMETQGMTFNEAVDNTVKRLNGYILGFLNDEQHIPVWGDPILDHGVRQYIQGLKDQIIATWHWQLSTNRYRSPNSPFPELRVMLTA